MQTGRLNSAACRKCFTTSESEAAQDHPNKPKKPETTQRTSRSPDSPTQPQKQGDPQKFHAPRTSHISRNRHKTTDDHKQLQATPSKPKTNPEKKNKHPTVTTKF